MARISPTLEGFRIAFRCPTLAFTEITWRWSVGISAVLLFVFAVIDYLDTLPVTNLDADLLATRQPLLIWQAVIHIFRGSLHRAMLAALFALFALSLLWMVAASIGRLAVLRALIECCGGTDSDRDVSDRDVRNPAASSGSAAFRSLMGLNFLRAIASLGALLAFFSAAIVANFAWPNANARPALGLLIFLSLAGMTAIIWIGLNWLLSFASVFVVQNGESTLGAVSAAVGLLNERLGPVLAVSSWNLMAHFAAFVIAASIASMLLVFISIVPAGVVIGGIILVALAYFAVVDWLYVARLAGYVCIAEMPEAFSSPAISPLPPSPGSLRAPNKTPSSLQTREATPAS